MSQVSQDGLFKGDIVDFAVSKTRVKELPQLVLTFAARELYNEADEVWIDWAEYQQTIIGYFVLVTLDENGNVVKCFSYDDIMEAVGWDGETYSGLAAMDLKGKRVQFRVVEEEFKGEMKMKVKSLKAEDADIGLRKLTGQDLTDLDSKFGTGTTSGKPKTAAKPKAKAKAKAAPKAPPKGKKARTPPAVPSEADTLGPCTHIEAYNYCVEFNDQLSKPVPAHIVDDYWTARVTEIAEDTENITDEEAAKIRKAVLEDIEIPF